MAVKIPLRVTMFLWLVLIFTAWNAAGLFTALAWSGVLSEFAARPALIAAVRALWTFVGLFVLWSIWRGKRWTRGAILIAGGAYAAWGWIDRLFIRAGLPPSWPFSLVVTLGLLGFTTWVVLDPKEITFFQREAYERQPED